MHCKVTLGRGQSWLMKWVLLRTMPQVQDWSLYQLTCSLARDHFATAVTPPPSLYTLLLFLFSKSASVMRSHMDEKSLNFYTNFEYGTDKPNYGWYALIPNTLTNTYTLIQHSKNVKDIFTTIDNKNHLYYIRQYYNLLKIALNCQFKRKDGKHLSTISTENWSFEIV